MAPCGETRGTKMIFTCFATNWINKDFETDHAFTQLFYLWGFGD